MRKYLPYILILLIVTPCVTYAVELNPIVWMNTGVATLGTLVLSVAEQVLSVAGTLFDISIKTAIDNTNFSGNKIVEEGWGISRDLANLAFIFILIYIGISTILQLGGRGAKELLMKVIIIALLVNFSFVIGQTVINASNVLADQFYTAMKPTEDSSLSAIFASGLKLQTIAYTKDTNFSLGGEATTLVEIVMISVFGIVIILIAAFVLFAGALMFIIRSVFLSILIILAPLAFVAMAIPQGQSYAKQWWSKLFSQSFFAPAFLFMFYLTAQTIQKGSFDTLFATQGASFAKFVFEGEGVGILVNYATLIILMLGTLTVSKLMGAAGADTTMKWGKTLSGKAQGYAGRIGKGGLRRSAAMPAKGVGFLAGTAAGALGQSKAGRAVGKVLPLKSMVTGSEKLLSANRGKIDELKKKYENYSPNQLKNMVGTASGFNRVAMTQRLAELKDLKPEGGLTSEGIATSQKLMERHGASTKDVKSLAWQYADKEADRIAAVPKVSANDIEKLDEIYFDSASTKNTLDIREATYKNFHGGHIKKMEDRTDNVHDKFIKNLIADSRASNISALTAYLESIDNRRFAKWTRSPDGRNTLNSYGLH
ncbi:hypothetical protein ACFLZC_01365 [Patescibacteria group bacterium]